VKLHKVFGDERLGLFKPHLELIQLRDIPQVAVDSDYLAAFVEDGHRGTQHLAAVSRIGDHRLSPARLDDLRRSAVAVPFLPRRR